jgi:hypothetical protein
MVSGAVRALVASLLLAPAGTLGVAGIRHPIHSTLAEVVQDPARGTLRATIRVFADDFGVALARRQRATLAGAGPAWEEAATRYAVSVFGVRDGRGRELPLHPCGIRRAGGVIWICLAADVVASNEGLQVRDAILCELYDDQVNVVQSNIGGARRSVLFVRGDGYKALR